MSFSLTQPRVPVWRYILDELFPVDCVLCGRACFALCPECLGELALSRAALPPLATLPTVPRTDVPLLIAVGDHVRARKVIAAFKDQHQTELATPLATLLTPVIREALDRATSATQSRAVAPVVITTIPATRASLRKRGFTPVRLILARAGFPSFVVLRSRGARGDQRRLDAASRVKNVQGNMDAHADIAGCAVILVDDVVTTGATADEAIRALRQAGAHVVAVVCLCAVPKVFPQIVSA